MTYQLNETEALTNEVYIGGVRYVPEDSVQIPDDVLEKAVETLVPVIMKHVEANIPQSKSTTSKKSRTPITVKNYKPKTTSGVTSEIEEIRQHIQELIAELSASEGLKFGLAWNKAYRLLYDKTGFDIHTAAMVRYRGKESKVRTVLDYGKGTDFVRVLRDYLDKN